MVLTDELRLKQIITNLLNNAIKFTPEGRIIFGYKILPDNMFEFFVSDTGIGIPKNKIKDIFTEFKQAHDNYIDNPWGAGLGLSIAKKLIERLGGQIEVESQLNKGTTFSFTHPIRAKKTIKKAPLVVSSREENTPDYRNKTILIAEDEMLNQEFF
ncbi:MAG: hypothetical protein HC896_00900 [Bacteroidales bacterium]|nr:hypothetical protein [Bacteroidales bacterium]